MDTAPLIRPAHHMTTLNQQENLNREALKFERDKFTNILTGCICINPGCPTDKLMSHIHSMEKIERKYSCVRIEDKCYERKPGV